MRAATGPNDSYITVMRTGAPVGTISFDPGDSGVPRLIATTADGAPVGLITSTGRSFRVDTPGTTDWCGDWHAAAEAVFGPGIDLEMT